MAVKERARAVDVKPTVARSAAAPPARAMRAATSAGVMSRLPSPQVAATILAGAARPAKVAAPAPAAKAPAAPDVAAAPATASVSVSLLGKTAGAVVSQSPSLAARALAPSVPAASSLSALTARAPAPGAPDQAEPMPLAPSSNDAAASPAATGKNGAPAAAPAGPRGEPGAEPAKDAKPGKGEEPKSKKQGDAEAEGGGPKKAPSPREAIAPAAAGVRQRAKGSRAHSDPDVPGRSAQAAAKVPATEQARGAAEQTVTGMAANTKDARAVARETFKAALKKKIAETTQQPKTEAEATRVRQQGATDASAALKSDLGTRRDAASGPLKDAAKTEVAPADVHTDPETKLSEEPLGAPPAKVSAASVVPEPLPAERLDYSSDRAPTDGAMADAGVTKEQLEKGHDPAFGPTIEARSTAEKHEAKSEAQYRKSEGSVQAKGRATAQAEVAEGLAGMHGGREGQIGKIVTQQRATQSKDADERKRITGTIAGIKDRTKQTVTGILDAMDIEATRIFEDGLKDAERLYEKVFDDAKGGAWTWLTTWGDKWEELIEKSLGTARQAYLGRVDVAIDAVADYVDGQIEAAKTCVAAGLEEVKTFVAGLDASVQTFGKEALDAATEDFAALEGEIDERRDGLIDKLAEQYKASYERMSAMEEKLREENKSLWQRVYDATVGLIKKILAFKDMLLSILAKAAGVISDIIADPIGFLGNLVDGVMLGLKNFMGNIGAHLKKGLLDWLFGALGGAGLVLPETLDLQGIVSIVLQVLGLTYANFRARAVKIVGEPVVNALEQAAEVFKVLVTEGVPGLWRFIKDKVMDLKSMVLDAIFDFIKEKVIIAGVTWVIGLLNPASAFFKACKAIYDIVMFFINRGSQILALVNAVIDSMAAIAKGSIGVAAKFVEDALAKAIPVAIGFLASLLGLGDISGTIRKTIDKAQAPVNKAIDWVINGAVKLVKSAGNLVKGLFGKKKDEPKTQQEDADPAKAAKVTAGLADLNRSIATHEKNGTLKHEAAASVAAEVKTAHPVFSSISVRPSGQQWRFYYSASPEEPGPEAPMDQDEGVLEVSVVSKTPPGRSSVGPLALGTPASWGHDPTDPRRGSGRASPTIFEKRVGQAVARTSGVDAPPTNEKGKFIRGSLPASVAQDELIAAPSVGDFGKQPDFVLTGGGKVEVFEATLDAHFEIGTTEDVKETSHKRVQLAGTVVGLARLYPGVPIVFNIVTHRPLDADIRGRLERELRTLRAQLADEGLGNAVQIIWRS
jgi:hypothetical protein